MHTPSTGLDQPLHPLSLFFSLPLSKVPKHSCDSQLVYLNFTPLHLSRLSPPQDTIHFTSEDVVQLQPNAATIVIPDFAHIEMIADLESGHWPADLSLNKLKEMLISSANDTWKLSKDPQVALAITHIKGARVVNNSDFKIIISLHLDSLQVACKLVAMFETLRSQYPKAPSSYAAVLTSPSSQPCTFKMHFVASQGSPVGKIIDAEWAIVRLKGPTYINFADLGNLVGIMGTKHKLWTRVKCCYPDTFESITVAGRDIPSTDLILRVEGLSDHLPKDKIQIAVPLRELFKHNIGAANLPTLQTYTLSFKKRKTQPKPDAEAHEQHSAESAMCSKRPREAESKLREGGGAPA
jgi:hypothetical protein